MKKYKFTMEFSVWKDYEMEAENRDDAEALALVHFKENNLKDVDLDRVDGWAKFKSEEEITKNEV